MARNLWLWICIWSILWTIALAYSSPNEECEDASNLSNKIGEYVLFFSSEVDKIRNLNPNKKIQKVCLVRNSYLSPYELVYTFDDWEKISTSDITKWKN